MRLILLMGLIWLTAAACAQKKVGEMKNQTLLNAASGNDTIALKAAIADGANLEWSDNKGRTALMTATYKNNIAAAGILINAGANVNAQDDMLNSPFLYAGAEGLTEILKLCMKAGPDYNVFNRYGGSALIPACERAHLEVIEVLLADKKFPIDHINRLGWTALLEAVILGNGGKAHHQVVKMLIAAGVNVNIADKDGVTPLQHAKQKRYTEIVTMLEKAGAQ